MGSELLTTEETAELLRQKRRTLEDWRVRGIGPRFIRYTERGVRYRRRDIEAWLQEREFASTSDAK